MILSWYIPLFSECWKVYWAGILFCLFVLEGILSRCIFFSECLWGYWAVILFWLVSAGGDVDLVYSFVQWDFKAILNCYIVWFNECWGDTGVVYYLVSECWRRYWTVILFGLVSAGGDVELLYFSCLLSDGRILSRYIVLFSEFWRGYWDDILYCLVSAGRNIELVYCFV